MFSWLGTLIKDLVAWLSFRKGESSGAADQKQADQTAALTQQVEVDRAVTQAQASAPTDRAGVTDELRRGQF